MTAPHRRIAADRNDPAPVGKMRGRSLDRKKYSPHVDVQHRVEIIYAHGRDVTQPQDARVDDRYVQLPETIDGLRNGGFNGCRIGAVGPDRHAGLPIGFDRGDRFGGPFRRRNVGQGDIRAVLCQTPDRCCADAS